MKYQEPKEGEVMYVQRVGQDEWEMKLACCDCGLTHTLSFKRIGQKLGVKVYLDNRATGQIRRWKNKA